jgi:hypothetical protein
MDGSFAFVDDAAGIRQGDIIRKRKPDLTWGVILTADCDIARRKTGNQYTWLEIISLQDYLETQWASEQLGKLVEKELKQVCAKLNSLISKAGRSLAPLSPASACRWVSEASNQEILNSINSGGDFKDTRLLDSLWGKYR